MQFGKWFAISLFILALGAIVVAAIPAAGYHLLKQIPLGAAEGGGEYFDYITVDAASRHAYLSHGTEVVVLNVDSGSVVGKITGMKRNHGVALVPELSRGFISDGDAAQVVMFDLNTLKTIGTIKGEMDADSILYEPVTKHVFVFNGDSKSSTVIDPAKGTVIASIPRGGAPEQAVTDGKGTIYDNLEDTNEVVAIDSR